MKLDYNTKPEVSCAYLGALAYRGTTESKSKPDSKLLLALLKTTFAVFSMFTSKLSPATNTSDRRNLRMRIVNPSPNALLILLKIAGAKPWTD